MMVLVFSICDKITFRIDVITMCSLLLTSGTCCSFLETCIVALLIGSWVLFTSVKGKKWVSNVKESPSEMLYYSFVAFSFNNESVTIHQY